MPFRRSAEALLAGVENFANHSDLKVKSNY